jgi:hypothetical protein
MTPTRGETSGRAEPNPAGLWLYKDSLLEFAPVVDPPIYRSTKLPLDPIMSPVRVEDEPSTCLLYRDLHGKKPETVVEAQGSYLYLDDGRK